jgi:alanyl-tRNA synthetase
MTAKSIIDKYIEFFKEKGHIQIPNSPLVPENDPTTLFTSAGMQPLIPYLLGEKHSAGQRLVDVQNCFRAVDIEEVGDNRHSTFFRMLGNWSLGDYFKKEEIHWLWEFLTKGLGLPEKKLFITVFAGDEDAKVYFGKEANDIWLDVLMKQASIPDPQKRIFRGGSDKNWWSRSGTPSNMPAGEIGGPDTEVYYRFDDDIILHKKECKDNPIDCGCGKFLEIANSVFISYKKEVGGTFSHLPQKNVDFGGGVERLLAAVEGKSDIFETSLFVPMIRIIEAETGKRYEDYKIEMQVIADHMAASIFIANSKVKPSNKERGYVLRRLLRRSFDNFYSLGGKDISNIIEKVVDAYKDTDPQIAENFEEIKLTILDEEKSYKDTLGRAKTFIDKKYAGKEVEGTKEISAEDAFSLYSTHGLSPTQIRSLGYVFDEQEFAKKMEEHKNLSRTASSGMFKGGLADHSEKTIMGHTATHLLHQALRDVFGTGLHQTGSNITSERIRFDFNFERNLTPEELKKVEDMVNGKIKENLPVHFEIMSLARAKEIGAIGLFDEKYGNDVKVYLIGKPSKNYDLYYSKEFCGGPHVDFTSKLKRFKILKQENIGHGQRRIYASVGD